LGHFNTYWGKESCGFAAVGKNYRTASRRPWRLAVVSGDKKIIV
jgi:hypothetical protein